MARKSNKTAHVLNLLSGHDTKKEPEKELETDVKKDADPISEQDSQPKDAQQPHPDPEPTEKIPQGKISVPDSPSVSIIDQTEKDPVAEQIQANLFQEFQKEHDMNPLPIVAVRLNSAEASLSYIKAALAVLCDQKTYL